MTVLADAEARLRLLIAQWMPPEDRAIALDLMHQLVDSRNRWKQAALLDTPVLDVAIADLASRYATEHEDGITPPDDDTTEDL